MGDYAGIVQQYKANPYYDQINTFIQQQISQVNKAEVDAKYQQFLAQFKQKFVEAYPGKSAIRDRLRALIQILYQTDKNFLLQYFPTFINFGSANSMEPFSDLNQIVNILEYLDQGKSIYDFVQSNINTNDTSFEALYQNLQYYSLIIPDILNKVNQILTGQNYIFHYFTWLNPQLPEVQALLGKTELNITNFETGASLLAWPLQEQFLNIINQNLQYPTDNVREYLQIHGYDLNDLNDLQHDNVRNIWLIFYRTYMQNDTSLNTTGGWPKYKLRNAIVNSGLLEYRGVPYQKINQLQGNLAYQNMFKQLYDQSIRVANNPKYNDFDRLLRKFGLPWRSIGIDVDGYAPLNKNMSQKYFEALYRRIYGTVYTINWQQLCTSNQISIVDLNTLKFIIDTYFNPCQEYQLTNQQQACEIIGQFLPQLQAAINSVQGDPRNWIKFITSRYNQCMTQQQQKRGTGNGGAIQGARIRPRME